MNQINPNLKNDTVQADGPRIPLPTILRNPLSTITSFLPSLGEDSQEAETLSTNQVTKAQQEAASAKAELGIAQQKKDTGLTESVSFPKSNLGHAIEEKTQEPKEAKTKAQTTISPGRAFLKSARTAFLSIVPGGFLIDAALNAEETVSEIKQDTELTTKDSKKENTEEGEKKSAWSILSDTVTGIFKPVTDTVKKVFGFYETESGEENPEPWYTQWIPESVKEVASSTWDLFTGNYESPNAVDETQITREQEEQRILDDRRQQDEYYAEIERARLEEEQALRDAQELARAEEERNHCEIQERKEAKAKKELDEVKRELSSAGSNVSAIVFRKGASKSELEAVAKSEARYCEGAMANLAMIHDGKDLSYAFSKTGNSGNATIRVIDSFLNTGSTYDANLIADEYQAQQSRTFNA